MPQLLFLSGLKPEDIMAAIAKIDFKLGKQKFLEKPLYCKALRTLTPSKEDANNGENSEEKEATKDAEKEKKDEPKKKEDTNKEDKKNKHEEAINTKNEAKNKGQTPRIKHSSMSDITQYLSPTPYQSLFGNYMEVYKRNRKDDDDSSDVSPPVKHLTKKEKKNIKNDLHSSGIPKSSGSFAGSK